MRLRDLPIQRKLVAAIMLTSLAVLALTSIALVSYELYTYRETTRRTLSTIGDIIAANSTAVLIYDDQKLAAQILAGVRAEPEIRVAALYDQTGRIYAHYPAENPTDLPAQPLGDGIDFHVADVTLFAPVVEGQNRVGTLYLRGDLAGMYRRLGVYALVLGVVLICAGGLAISLSAYFQNLISLPILNLANIARRVSGNRDYSVRAHQVSNDELGEFTAAFNSMLDQIQRSHSALRASEERLSAVFQQAGSGIAHTDLSGRFLMVNDRYCEMVGRSRDSLLQLRMHHLIHPADLAQYQFLTEHSARNGASFVLETRYDRPQGGFVWVRNSVAFIRSPDGDVESTIAVAEDITNSKRTEKELERARDEALAASRAKDDFLATLSHELRTPLNPVLLLASEAAEDTTLSDAVRTDFATIRNNVELEARLIDDLLDLTRITRGKLLLDLKPHDLHSVLRDALATVKADVDRKRIEANLKFNSPRSVVLSDAVRLQQVFWNVLKNAVKFTPEQGMITVQTCILPDSEEVLIDITDTGIGMEPHEIERIFDAFSQGDHAAATGSHRFGGVGLGLAISRMLVELHRGTIQAASSGRGQGSTFRVTLPLLRSDYVPRPASNHPFSPAESSNFAPGHEGLHGRILLIEDHAPTRSTLEHLLTRRHYEVVSAGTVAEARALADKEHIDFVISDIGLPDGNAYDLMTELRSQRGLTGIALTGYGMESDIARSHAAGFVVHLTKPLRVQSLDEALARLVATLPRSGDPASEA